MEYDLKVNCTLDRKRCTGNLAFDYLYIAQHLKGFQDHLITKTDQPVNVANRDHGKRMTLIQIINSAE